MIVGNLKCGYGKSFVAKFIVKLIRYFIYYLKEIPYRCGWLNDFANSCSYGSHIGV